MYKDSIRYFRGSVRTNGVCPSQTTTPLVHILLYPYPFAEFTTPLLPSPAHSRLNNEPRRPKPTPYLLPPHSMEASPCRPSPARLPVFGISSRPAGHQSRSVIHCLLSPLIPRVTRPDQPANTLHQSLHAAVQLDIAAQEPTVAAGVAVKRKKGRRGGGRKRRRRTLERMSARSGTRP
jgi:hypothetical protein